MNSRRKLTVAVVAAALQLLAALSASGTATRAASAGARRAPLSDSGAQRRAGRKRKSDALIPGVWGGRHIRFEVTQSGASVEYDCAHETVEGRIIVDRFGRFSVRGTHYEEHGGPVRAGETEESYPVRLTGRVGGSLMKLTVKRADTNRTVGTFNLTRDREAELFKCR